MPSLPCCTLCEGVHPQSLGATPRWVATETTVFVSCEDYDPVTYNEPITFHFYSDKLLQDPDKLFTDSTWTLRL